MPDPDQDENLPREAREFLQREDQFEEHKQALLEERETVEFFAYDRLLDRSILRRWAEIEEEGKLVYIPNHRLVFVRWGGSEGKVYPTIERTNRSEDKVWGIIWEVLSESWKKLERRRNVPHRYYVSKRSVKDRGGHIQKKFTFVLNRSDLEETAPGEDDMRRVVQAAHRRGLPDDYIQQLHEMVASD